MRHSFKSHHAQATPAKSKLASTSEAKASSQRPDLNRLAFDLAAEWCSGRDEYQPHPFETAL